MHRIVKKFEELGTENLLFSKLYHEAHETDSMHNYSPCTGNPGIRISMYLWEIQRELHSVFNLEVSPAAVYRSLKVSNFSTKKDAASSSSERSTAPS